MPSKKKHKRSDGFNSAYHFAWEAGSVQTCRVCGDEYNRPTYLVSSPCVPCRDRLEADREARTGMLGWCLCPICGGMVAESGEHACPFCDGQGWIDASKPTSVPVGPFRASVHCARWRLCERAIAYGEYNGIAAALEWLGRAEPPLVTDPLTGEVDVDEDFVYQTWPDGDAWPPTVWMQADTLRKVEPERIILGEIARRERAGLPALMLRPPDTRKLFALPGKPKKTKGESHIIPQPVAS